MRTFIKLLFLAFSSMLILNPFLLTEAKAQVLDIDFPSLIDKQQNSLKSLRSNIKLIEYNSSLKESDTYEGSLIYLPVKKQKPLIRIDWSKPVQEAFTVVNGKYAFSPRRRLQMNIVGKLDSAEKGHHIAEILSFFNMSVK